MGQAFDRNGNVLGEAFGETKREVFDKLAAQFKDADEIRIRTFHRSGEADPHVGAGASAEMPRYRCHKEVWALKIAKVVLDSDNAQREIPSRETDGSALLYPADTAYGMIRVNREYVRKHNPQAGGYYVVYQDGYKSFSPADAFEDGYSLIQPAGGTEAR